MAGNRKKPVIIENVNIYELEHAKLLRFAQNLREKLENERKIRTLIQVDRDQLNVFWRITKTNLSKLVSDVASIQGAVEKSAAQIIDLEELLRKERESFDFENVYNSEKIQLEYEEIAKTLALECKNQTDELFTLNISLQNIIETKDVQHKNETKYIKQNYAKLVKEENIRLKNQMTQELTEMEEQQDNVFHKIGISQYLELNKCQQIYDENMKITIDNYNREIKKLKTEFQDKYENELFIIKQLKYELLKVMEEGQCLKRRLSELTEKNGKLLSDFQENKNKNEYLERRIVFYKRCTKTVDLYIKELNKYKTLLEIKSRENVELENDNVEMKRNFKQYDEHFMSTLDNLQRRAIEEHFSTG